MLAEPDGAKGASAELFAELVEVLDVCHSLKSFVALKRQDMVDFRGALFDALLPGVFDDVVLNLAFDHGRLVG